MDSLVCSDSKIRALRTKDARVQAQEMVALARELNLKVRGEAMSSIKLQVSGWKDDGSAQGKERL
jgi:hypothetical protein